MPFIKPGVSPEGLPLVVRFPHNPLHILDAQGEDVPDVQFQTAYWQARLKEGDVVLATPPKPRNNDPQAAE